MSGDVSGTQTTYQRAEGESTQWEDIQRRLGNLPAAEPVWKPEAYKPQEEAARDRALLDSKASPEELEELEDDFADDRFLEEYRWGRAEAPRACRGLECRGL